MSIFLTFCVLHGLCAAILSFCAQSELSAGCFDIAAQLPTDRCIDAVPLQGLGKAHGVLSARRTKSRFLYLIEHNEIHMTGTAHTVFDHLGKGNRIGIPVVFPFDQGVFKENL